MDIIGQTFGRLTIIGPSEKKDCIKCRCICGNIVDKHRGNVLSGKTKSCGCLNKELASQRRLQDLTGKTFGRLTVIKRSENNCKDGQPKWICRCECSNIVEVRGEYLKSGSAKSCGCLRKELLRNRRLKWKFKEEKYLITIFSGMKERCYNKKSDNYSRYGGRGIIICREWLDNPRLFIEWSLNNGYKENSNLSIDRIDNNGPYSPSNCKWSTKTEQANNRRSNWNITIKGITHTFAEWNRIVGYKYITLWEKPEEEIYNIIEEYLNKGEHIE